MSQRSEVNFLNYAPIGTGALVFVLTLSFNEQLVALIQADEIQLTSIYSAIFDWAAIQTGFLFSVFGYIAGKSDGFLAAIRNTPGMKNLYGYIRRATIMGFTLTILSIPLVMLDAKPAGLDASYVFVCAWFSLFFWAFLSFLRVAYIFGIIVKVPDRRDIPA